MRRQLEVLRILADGRFHSGEAVAARLGISRALVWKALKSLETLGVEVHAVRGRGYRLAQPLELLDVDLIRDALGAAADRLERLELLDQVDSTNAYLLAQAGAAPHACLAEHQHAGRGRRGRQWVSPFGANLYLSLSWPFDSRPLEGLSLAVAVALMRSLHRAGAEGLGLKWPNDVLWQGRKLGGILLEMSGEAGGAMRAVVGIGLNLHMPRSTAGIDQPWTDLQSVLGRPCSRNRIAGELLNELVDALEAFAGAGMQPFMDEWAAYDLAYDRPIELHLPDRVVAGVARGIDETGALLVAHGDTLQRYFSGEVSLRMTAATP